MRLCFEIFALILCGVSFVKSFSWQSCGMSTYPLKITSLDVYSNPGTKILYATGRGKAAMNITAPIKGDVFMQKKFFWGWTTLPCVDHLGSCIYQDMCALSPYSSNSCPKEFTNNQLPCTCPILEGQYAAKRFPIDLALLPKWLVEGTYKIRLKLLQNEEEIFCILINITL